jgi:hypothetical protein
MAALLSKLLQPVPRFATAITSFEFVRQDLHRSYGLYISISRRRPCV